MEMCRLALILFAVFAVAVPARAERFLVDGPVRATVVRVIDGDTILVDAEPWPQHKIRVSVRLRGIDAPEKRSRCESERLAALKAKRALEASIGDNPAIQLTAIEGGKYFGRILADARVGGRDLASDLLGAGLVRPYRGGRRTKISCP